MQYVKIKDVIAEQIRTGQLAAGQKLPSERQLAESFNTTRITLREALSLLEAEGQIYREDRRGWFIAPSPLHYDPQQAMDFATLARAQNRQPHIMPIQAQAEFADRQASQLLALPPFSELYRIEQVQSLDTRPVAWVSYYCRPELLPNLFEHDFTHSLFSLLREQGSKAMHHLRYRVGAGSLVGDVAQRLRATSGAPAIVIEKCYYSEQGEALLGIVEQWRHDALRVESQVNITVDK